MWTLALPPSSQISPLDLSEFVGVATDQCHLRAQARQLVRGAAADAAAATGHDDDLVCEQAGTEYRVIYHAFDLARFGSAARPARARATIIFMMPAVPSPISRPMTSRRRC